MAADGLCEMLWKCPSWKWRSILLLWLLRGFVSAVLKQMSLWLVDYRCDCTRDSGFCTLLCVHYYPLIFGVSLSILNLSTWTRIISRPLYFNWAPTERSWMLSIFFFSYIIYCKHATDVACSTCDDPGRELFLLLLFFSSSQSLYLAAALMEEAASPAGSLSKWAVIYLFFLNVPVCLPPRSVRSFSGLIYIRHMFGLALVIDNFLGQHRTLTPHFWGLTELFLFCVDIDLLLINYLPWRLLCWPPPCCE